MKSHPHWLRIFSATALLLFVSACSRRPSELPILDCGIVNEKLPRELFRARLRQANIDSGAFAGNAAD